MGKKQPLGVSKKTGKKFEYVPPASQTDAQRLQAAPRSHNLANLFQDRRFGANDPRLDEETKNLKRFTKERQFLSKRKEKFALDDDEAFTLTHKGENLSELPDDYVQDFEPHDSPEASDLDQEAVSQLHFSSHPDSRTPRERYEEIIAKSKYNKYLQHKEKEDMRVLTSQVDKELPAVQRTMQFREFRANRPMDDYDLLVNELKDEVRVNADSDRGYLAALEVQQSLQASGLDFSLPESYPDFLTKLTAQDSPAANLRHFLAWNSPKLPSEQGKSQQLLTYLLRFLTQEPAIPALIRSQEYGPVLAATHHLCVQYPETASECISSLLESGCGGLPNTLACLDLVGSLAPIRNSADDTVACLRRLCERTLLRTSLKTEEKCCWAVLFATVYAHKWLFAGELFAPELFGLVTRVLKRTQSEAGAEVKAVPLRELVGSPSYLAAKNACLSLLAKSFKVYKSVAFRSFFARFLPIAGNSGLEDAYKSVFDGVEGELHIQVSKVQEIPSYEPLLLDKVTTLHKNKDLNKTITETDKLKSELKSAKKEARKAIQRQSFAEEMRKQEERRLEREGREKKGRKAVATLDGLQAEYKRMVTSQGELRRRKEKRRRMAGGEVEKT